MHLQFNNTRVVNNIVQGNVVDKIGPIYGANVFLKSDPTIGTSTDENGRFYLPDVPTGEIIVISYMGLKTISFKNDGKPKSFVMTESIEQLDELVINSTKPVKNVLGKAIVAGGLLFGIIALTNKKKGTGLAAPSKLQSKLKTVKFTI